MEDVSSRDDTDSDDDSRYASSSDNDTRDDTDQDDDFRRDSSLETDY
jgi:hypothetical protein